MTIVLVSLAIIGYTYVGYPLLVAALARLFPRRIARDEAYEPTVTLCVPVCDDARSLHRKLDSLGALDYPGDKLELLLFSDGSSDGTDAIAAAAAWRDSRVRVLRSASRRGKPHALNRMMAAARGEVLVLTDARQPIAPDAIRHLVATLADDSVGCVSGTLRLAGGAGAGAYWRYELWIRRSESQFRGIVGATGALYALRRRDAVPLPEDIVLDDVWLPLQVRRRGGRLVLCERAEVYDVARDDRGELERKARTLCGNYQLLRRMPRLLLPIASPCWFELVSHKLARLLCPWAFAALLIASVAVVAGDPRATWGWAIRVLVAAQIAAYAAAWLGHRAGRLGRLARTFAVLNAAAVVGLWRFARGSQPVAWQRGLHEGRG